MVTGMLQQTKSPHHLKIYNYLIMNDKSMKNTLTNYVAFQSQIKY